jgi:hypothetical protein
MLCVICCSADNIWEVNAEFADWTQLDWVDVSDEAAEDKEDAVVDDDVGSDDDDVNMVGGQNGGRPGVFAVLAHACMIACWFGEGFGPCDGIVSWGADDADGDEGITCPNAFIAKLSSITAIATSTAPNANDVMMATVAIVDIAFVSFIIIINN